MGTTAQKLQAVVNSKAAIKAAIEAKGVADVGDVLSTYAEKIASISSGGAWTGHADEAGLKAIGWTDDDIAYYQKYGVNWNEEDDQYHLVPEDNKALYGVLNANNISTYAKRIVYLPKIDTSRVTSAYGMFNGCSALVALPMLDTSRVDSMGSMFLDCYSLVCVPQLNTSNVGVMNSMFSGCYSLVHVPQFDTSAVYNMNSMFYACYSLTCVPNMDTSKVTDMMDMFSSCSALKRIVQMDASNVQDVDGMFFDCYSLEYVYIKNLTQWLDINSSEILDKSSIIYMIDNTSPTSDVTLTLSPYCYNKYSNDPDVIAALSDKPLFSLSS